MLNILCFDMAKLLKILTHRRFNLCFISGTIFTLFTMYYYIINCLTIPRPEGTVETASHSVTSLYSNKPRAEVIEPENHSLTSLYNNSILIVAAYHDNREKNLVRLISIVRRKEVTELYCGLTCGNTSGKVYMQKADIDYIAHDFGFPYVIAHLLCPKVSNCVPKYVSIHLSDKANGNKVPYFEIRNGQPKKHSVEFTVCISTMFGNNTNVLQYAQAIEMYKLLGAQKVMIYKHSCSPLMDKMLQHYIAEGTVEVIPWPIDLYLKLSKQWNFSLEPGDLGYYGQLATLNDCLYRNMYKSKYVVLNDLDEIILPRKHQNWSMMISELLKQHPRTSVFYFENQLFDKTVFDSKFNKSTWNKIPGINILEHVYRIPKRPYHEKMIVNPREVNQISVHSVLKHHGAALMVPDDIAFMYHCTTIPEPHVPKASLIRDAAIWNHSSALIQQIEMLLNMLSVES